MTSAFVPYLVVTGGRDFGYVPPGVLAAAGPMRSRLIAKAKAQADAIRHALHHLNPRVIIHGGATGMDTVCGEWGRKAGCDVRAFPVSREEWKAIGPSAGIKRNIRMDQVVGEMIGFGVRVEGLVAPGGKGTADMARRLRRRPMKVHDLATVLKDSNYTREDWL